MQPINYMTQVQSPFAAALQGYEMGSAMRQMEAQRQAQELAVVEQQRKMEQQQALQAKLSAFYAAPTVDSRAAFEIASMLPKDQSEAFRKSYEMLGVDEQKAELSFSSQVFSAANAGKPEMAVQLLKDRAAAEQDPRKAKSFNDAARMMELDPKMATRTAAVMIAQFPGGDKVLEGATRIGTEERAVAAEGRAVAAEERAVQLFAPELQTKQSAAEKARVEAKYAEDLAKAGVSEKNWAVKNLQSQIGDRAQRLGIERQRLALETQEKLASIQEKLTSIPPGIQPELNKAAVAAGAARQSQRSLDSLAERFAKESVAGGAAASAAESLKKLTGNQDALTQLRQEYTRIRNTQAQKFLPPGPATDKDVALALEGFPPPTADATQMASFLRGMAKMSAIEASVESARVDWMANNKGLLTRANNSFIAGDYAAKAGETFEEFASRVAADVSKRREPPKQQPGAQATAPARQDLLNSADAIISGRR
jgi:hypothetical protein